jgi:predicted dehydrogenase
MRIFRSFAGCIRSDTEPDPNALEGARGVAVGDAAWESIRTGKPVRVKRDF